MFLSETIRLFLDSLGRSEEYEFYLRKFKSDRSAHFSILCPDLDSLQRSGDVLYYNFRFLTRLDLYPAILLCGPQVGEMVRLLEDSADGENLYFSLELSREILVSDGLGELIQERSRLAREEGKILLLRVQASPAAALPRLAPLISRRVLFIRIRGALRTVQDEAISLYRIRRNLPELNFRDRVLRELALEMLRVDKNLHIAVATPFDMLKEIFTVKGAGTILRTGSALRVERDRSFVDERRLLTLLETCFGRELADHNILERVSLYILEENYRGAILLEERPQGAYLSKFAVDTEGRGEGLAQELWEEALERTSALFWRSRVENSISRWYSNLSDGRHRQGDWNVFWRGVAPDSISAILRYCLERPQDFK